MKRKAQRALAVLLGSTFAFGLLIGIAAIAYPNLLSIVIPPSGDEIDLPISEVPQGHGCPQSSSSMRVHSTAIGQHDEPLVKRHVGLDGQSVRVEFSGGWAETKVLHLAFNERSTSLAASYETDYGNFPGSVDVADSRVHRQSEAMCLDLSVQRMDGSSIRERWLAVVPLP